MATRRTETLITKYQADASQLLTELRKLDKSAKQTAQGMRGLNQRLDRAGNIFKRFASAAGIGAAGFALQQFARTLATSATAIGEFGDKLEFAQLRFNSFAGSNAGVAKVADAANQLGITIDELGQSVNLFIPAFDRIGVSFDEGIEFIDNLTNSMRVFGVEAVSASRASIQLAQAVGSSRLYGEELRSLQENAGGLAAQFERAVVSITGINKPLRILGAEGKITADVFYEAWNQVFADLDDRIREIPETIRFQKNRVKNAASVLATTFNEAFDIDEKVEATLGYIQQLLLNFSVSLGTGGLELIPTENLEQQLAAAQTNLERLQRIAPDSFREAQELIEAGTEGISSIDKFFNNMRRQLKPFLADAYSDLQRIQRIQTELARREAAGPSSSEGDMLAAEKQAEAVNDALKEREKLWKSLLTLTREEVQLDEKITDLSEQKRQLIDVGGSQEALRVLDEQLNIIGNRFEYVIDEARAVSQQLLKNKEFLENMGAATAELAAKERERNKAFVDLLEAREYDKAKKFIEEEIKAQEKQNRIIEEQNDLLKEAQQTVSDGYRDVILAYDEQAAAAFRYQEAVTAIKNAEAAGEGTAARRAELLEKARNEYRLITDEAYKLKIAIADEVATAFGSWIDSAVEGTFKLRDAIRGLAADLAKLFLRQALTNTLSNAFPNFFKAAQGAAFNQLALPQGVYNQPTYFSMPDTGPLKRYARGGVLGEAGPEAVLPLRRTASGDLGVQAGATTVQINNYTGESVRQRRRQLGDREIIEIAVGQMEERIARGGNSTARTLQQAYPNMRRGRR